MFRKKALSALITSHCSEALECLLQIFKMEKLEASNEKEELEKQVKSKFIEVGSEKEICLPSSFRTQVLTKGDSVIFQEVKKHVLADLRFNEHLLGALQSC